MPISTKTIPPIWRIPPSYAVTGGRPKGVALRDAVLSELHKCPLDGVLRVDFAAIDTLDFSAADEVVGGLIRRVLAEDGSRRFVLTGLNESVRESIAAVLTLRKRQCLELSANGQIRVLGPLSSAHEETLHFVTDRGEVAVADVAARFWQPANMTAAANRLNTLLQAGLVTRRLDRGGPRGNRSLYVSILPLVARPSQKTTAKSTKAKSSGSVRGERGRS